jgi:predicted lipoprotein with Yx(FWY)xxD motif
MFSMVKLSLICVPVLISLLLLGCGGSSSVAGRPAGTSSEPWYLRGGLSPPADTRHVVVRELPHHGLVLVDGEGRTLYVFVPDKPGATCTGSCATTWPPFELTPEHVLDSAPSVSIELIKVQPKERYPAGLRMVSYAGRLLHSYAGDTSAGMIRGQGLHSDGGHWYLISTSGKPITGTL